MDDNIASHPKFLAAGPVASWLWVCGNCYCNRHLTDGFIPAQGLALVCAIPNIETEAAKLVAVRLWELADGGYRVHDFHDHNPHATDVKDRRERDRRRKQQTESTRNPDGIHAESSGNPQGIQAPRARDPIPSHPIPDLSSNNKHNVEPKSDAAAKKMPPDVKSFLGWFQAEYTRRRHGAKYFVRWDSHGAIVKRLLKLHQPDRLRKHAVLLLTTDEDWSSSTDRGIEVLSAKINWLEERLAGWEKRKAGREQV